MTDPLVVLTYAVYMGDGWLVGYVDRISGESEETQSTDQWRARQINGNVMGTFDLKEAATVLRVRAYKAIRPDMTETEIRKILEEDIDNVKA